MDRARAKNTPSLHSDQSLDKGNNLKVVNRGKCWDLGVWSSQLFCETLVLNE